MILITFHSNHSPLRRKMQKMRYIGDTSVLPDDLLKTTQ